MTTQQQPQYKPGDVANGHRLDESGTWQPLIGTTPAPKKKHTTRNVLLVLGAFFLLMFIVGVMSETDEPTEPSNVSRDLNTNDTADDVAPIPLEPAPVEPAPAPEPPVPAEPELSVSQSNAVRSAEDYLDYSAFSRTGLIGQLEYEGFSTEDATFAVDKVGADWSQQAAFAAQQYLDYSSFSRSGLIDQLMYEGYTAAEAEYGATQVGL